MSFVAIQTIELLRIIDKQNKTKQKKNKKKKTNLNNKKNQI